MASNPLEHLSHMIPLQRIQGLGFDAQGRLHALDSFIAKGQVLNPLDGAFISSYGEPGRGAGQLHLPLGVAVDPTTGNAIVANSENRLMEMYVTVAIVYFVLCSLAQLYVRNLQKRFAHE